MYERLYKTESQLVDAFFRLDQLIPGQIASVHAKVNSVVVQCDQLLWDLAGSRLSSCEPRLLPAIPLPEHEGGDDSHHGP